jgi:chromate transport protein ChrA
MKPAPITFLALGAVITLAYYESVFRPALLIGFGFFILATIFQLFVDKWEKRIQKFIKEICNLCGQ